MLFIVRFAFAIYLSLIAWFTVALTFAQEVTITFRDGPNIVPCPPPEPVVTKRADGTYKREPVTTVNAVLCYDGKISAWREEWTDYPEKGGKFIRRLP